MLILKLHFLWDLKSIFEWKELIQLFSSKKSIYTGKSPFYNGNFALFFNAAEMPNIDSISEINADGISKTQYSARYILAFEGSKAFNIRVSKLSFLFTVATFELLCSKLVFNVDYTVRWAEIKWTSKKHEKYYHSIEVGTLWVHNPLCLKSYKIRTPMKNFKKPNFKINW